MLYASIRDHHSMFFDQTRNDAYHRALESVITPDSIVLDLGAGLGIHGLLAAKLGAKKVYLVEPQDVICVAKKFVQANDFTGQVECIQGRIEEITLPEQVDVIISVFTGNLLLEEDLLPSLFYTRDTYLKPGGFLFPKAAIMEAVPVSLPKFHKEMIGIWSQSYRGLDFSLAKRQAANTIYYNRKALQMAENLAAPLPLMALDFHTAQDTNCQTTVDYQILTSGSCHGMVVWITIQLNDEYLSTAPHTPKVHWTPAFLPFDPPLDLNEGEQLKFYLVRPAFDHWSWRVTTAMIDQKYSTFISQTLSSQTINKIYPNYQPSRSLQGDLVYDILACFNSFTSVQDIADKITKKHLDIGLSRTQLLHLITNLIKKYSR